MLLPFVLVSVVALLGLPFVLVFVVAWLGFVLCVSKVVQTIDVTVVEVSCGDDITSVEVGTGFGAVSKISKNQQINQLQYFITENTDLTKHCLYDILPRQTGLDCATDAKYL